jgi:hypothetical protein
MPELERPAAGTACLLSHALARESESRVIAEA